MSDRRSLYEQDFLRRSDEQAAAIRAAAGSGTKLSLDWENLAEEIESLGRSQRSELSSRTRTIVEHLLKRECSSSIEPWRGWTETVLRTRLDIDDLLKVSPSLRRELATVLEDVQASTAKLTATLLIAAGEVETGVEARIRCGGTRSSRSSAPGFRTTAATERRRSRDHATRHRETIVPRVQHLISHVMPNV